MTRAMLMMGSSFTFHPATQAAAAAAAPAAHPAAKGSFSFDDFIDIVNPLQHLPVVGTIYRAVTHDQIKTPEKIIGDTLYGGLMGLVSSVADTLFESVTGHNFGDTVLGFLTGHHGETAVAADDNQAPQAATTPAAPMQTASADETALTQSLNRSGADNVTTERALYAYRRANGRPAQAAASPF